MLLITFLESGHRPFISIICTDMFGALLFIYCIIRLTTTKANSTYLWYQSTVTAHNI